MKRISPTLAACLLIAAFLLVAIVFASLPYLQNGQGGEDWISPSLQTSTPSTSLSNNITPWWTTMPTAPGLGVAPIFTSTQ